MIAKSVGEEVYNCIKCGICLGQCPVYKQNLVEVASPRGKIQLIRNIIEGKLEWSRHFEDILYTCLLCETCTTNCPSGLRVDRLLKAMRAESIERYGLPARKAFLFDLLTGKRHLPFYLFWGRILRNNLLPLLPLNGRVGTIPFNRFPRLNGKPFLMEVPEIHAVPQPKGRVLYFTGCATNYVASEIGRATIKVLTRLGIEVIVPRDQMCCGLPVFLAGAVRTAVPNILKNVSLFNRSGIDAVVVECATCGSALKKEYPRILEEAGINADAAYALSAKVMDISQYLMKFDLPKMLKPVPGKVTYHDPCHLLRSQKIKEEPRVLLKQIPGLELVEMAGADVCCGGGGTFQWEHPGVAAPITARKIESIERTGAHFVATGCPGCRLQIAGNLKREDIAVIHPIELLAAGFGS